MTYKRTLKDKLNTLLFGKDLRITEGEPYTEIRPFDYSSYLPLDNYTFFEKIPTENAFDIRLFGADTKNEDNAEAINRAISAAAETGGAVVVAGGEYTSSTIFLKSGVTLFIEQASALVSGDGEKLKEKGAFIYGKNADNITFCGGGRVKGNGHLYGRKPLAEENRTKQVEYIDVIEMRRDYRSQLRFAHESKYGGIISLDTCKNVKVNNFVLENSPHWTFKISNCDGVDIRNFVINNNRNVANADGIDIAGTSNVTIEHCFISTADDGIVIKNAIWLGNGGAMENISISDCEIISRTNAIKVGTETTYDISKIRMRDCKLFMTDLYPGSVSGISLEAVDGARVFDILIEDIYMNRCTCPLFIRLGNRNRASKVNAATSNAIEFGQKVKFQPSAEKKTFDGKSEMKNIIVRNLVADEVEIPVIIAGYRQKGKTKRVENVTIENVTLNYAAIPEVLDRRLFIPEYAKEYPEGWRFRNLPAYALWARHTKNLKTVNFVCNHPLKSERKDIISLP